MARIEMLYTLAGGLKKGTTFLHDLVEDDPIWRLIKGGFARTVDEGDDPMVSPTVQQAQPVPAPRVPGPADEPDTGVPAEPEPTPAAEPTKDTTASKSDK